MAGDGSRNEGIVGDQSLTLGFSEDADPLNTPVISAFSTLSASIATKFAVVEGDFEPYRIDTTNSDAIYAATSDDGYNQKFYILPDNNKQNTPSLIVEQYDGEEPYSPFWTGTYWEEADVYEGYLPQALEAVPGGY